MKCLQISDKFKSKAYAMSWSIRMSPSHIVSVWTLIFGYLYIGRHKSQGTTSADAQLADIVTVKVVSGGDTELPCSTQSLLPSDVLLLVAWYKDDVPMYSYDTRSSEASHWADGMLAGRASWHNGEPSMLQLKEVQSSDHALYRCRVDFKVSPTLNQKILLDVIELPDNPKVFDELDNEVVDVAGPYVEDISIKLTCVVSGGNPMPRVRWWREDKVISTLTPANDGSSLSMLELRILKLTRDHSEAVYYCTADNTDLVPPQRANVQIQLYLRPLFVKILPREQPLSVQQEADIACQTAGARPPAIISWWLNNSKLVSLEQKTSADQNETLSVLRWTPQMQNNGQVLECHASHIYLKHFTIKSNITLNLHYVPIAVLKLGFKLNPEDIKEGDDVYFECVVQANPPPYKVIWEHNGQPMTHGVRAGVIAGSVHLALQGVSRDQAGRYSCTAFNVEGDGISTPLQLQVVYKPACKTSDTAIVGTTIGEEVQILCDVDAHPQPKSYQWILNNSLDIIELDLDKFTIANGSIFSFTPTSEDDFGTISCKATNAEGQQKEPCRYNLIAATRPDQPHNCSTSYMSYDAVEVRCKAGSDGGLSAVYIAEAWETNEIVLNSSRLSPVWYLRGLGSRKALRILLYSKNAKGRSENTTLKIHMPPRSALNTEPRSIDGAEWNWMLGILAGLTAAAIIVVISNILLTRRRYHQSAQYSDANFPLKANVDTIAQNEYLQDTKENTPTGTKAYNSTQNGNQSSTQPDDKNPDVVQLAQDDSEMLPKSPPPYGFTSLSGLSKIPNSLQHETWSNAHLPNKPDSNTQSIGSPVGDRRSVTSGTSPRRHDIVTTRTPLLANTRESCV